MRAHQVTPAGRFQRHTFNRCMGSSPDGFDFGSAAKQPVDDEREHGTQAVAAFGAWMTLDSSGAKLTVSSQNTNNLEVP